jgi:hypothetical protein
MVRCAFGALLIAAATVAAPRPALACNTASCPLITQSQGNVRDQGPFRLDLSYRFMNERRVVGDNAGTGLAGPPTGSSDCSTPAPGAVSCSSNAASVTLTGASPLLYRFGDEVDLSAGIAGQVSKRVQVSGQVGFRRWGRDEFRGVEVPRRERPWSASSPASA